MNVACYMFYVFVYVFRNFLMLYQIFQNTPSKEYFKIIKHTQLQKIQTINGRWHLSPLRARTKVSLIWSIRSQQLCRGTGDIRLTIKFYSDQNRSLRLSKKSIKKIFQSLMRLYHTMVTLSQQLCSSTAVVWYRGIYEIYINIMNCNSIILIIYCVLSVCLSRTAAHGKVVSIPLNLLGKVIQLLILLQNEYVQ